MTMKPCLGPFGVLVYLLRDQIARQHYKQMPNNPQSLAMGHWNSQTISNLIVFESPIEWRYSRPSFDPYLLSGKQSSAYLLLRLPSCEFPCSGKKVVAQ